MAELEKTYNPKSVEEEIYKLWEKSGYFNPDNLEAKKENYTILLPPPNVTGSLHIGHALNATISDILIRYHRLKGYAAGWLPGIDHAGIATQNVVEKQLRKEGVSRFEIGREKFVEKVWEWKAKYGNIILDQLKKLGASCDWSRVRFTLDENYSADVKKAFIHYYEKGLIYRGERVINWCPRCRTSLSDLEIEYEQEKTKLWFIKYPLADKAGHIIVATTRPETMLGDEAVAVNPKDKRYKNFIGKKVVLPIKNKEIPIISDAAIDKTFGTGAVKVTPAHDLLDAEIGTRHNLPFTQIINEVGKMNKNAGEICQGLKVAECREKVVEKLQAENLIEKEEEYTHNVAKCYRCNSTLEPILSKQWFLKMDELAKQSAKAVNSKKVKIVPKNFEKPYLNWLANIRDWCISRQIWWGHQLPVWFHEPKCVPKQGHEGDIVKCKEMIVSLEKPSCEYCDAEFKQSEDVLDTWFSSALWPFGGLSEKDLDKFYPSNVLITARDIINLWVGRMIFSGLEFKKAVPFPATLIHGTILTKEGKRMSKSLGTGIDPLLLIENYGADALRFGIIWQSMGNQDIRWDEAAVIAGKKFANKVWNATRFILMQEAKSDAKEKITAADKKILAQLKTVKNKVEKDIAAFKFGQALHDFYDFFWHQFCDIYLEAVKQEKSSETIKILRSTLIESLKLLHPFMPFLTEKIYQELPDKEKELLMIESI